MAKAKTTLADQINLDNVKSVALRRLIEEVRRENAEEESATAGYNRVYNRTMSSPGGYNRVYNRHNR